MDIREFLEARLSEDELWAKAASADPDATTTVSGGMHWSWAINNDWDLVEPDPLEPYMGGYGGQWAQHVLLRSVEEFGSLRLPVAIAESDEVRTADGAHIVRHDPARVLRDVEAKRLILARHTPEEQWGGPKEARVVHAVWCTGCWDGNCVTDYDMTCSQENWPCPEVRALASVWSDHPDYDPSWSPQAAS